ncbi:4790_t:CDS:1 [Dentiscutata heterogama]|uniref:4790_t:CDS:1 n=1 Tax=Dentiscutata heterogama TaxID=1316150 RepID=A0ACA9MVQ3_9GLOM|nr:4790_t:CDS:1 [Dentiscutata heterogama]
MVNRLSELIKLGFELHYTVIVDTLLIEKRLVEVGNILIKAFLQIKNESMDEFLHKCLIEILRIFRLDKRLKKTDVVLNFLYSVIEKDHEKVFLKAMEFENRLDDNNDSPFMSLNFSAFYYSWILNKFGADTEITKWCFNDILEKIIKVDSFIKQNQHYVLSEQFENNFKELYDAFKNYTNTKNFFKPSHLKIIKQATHIDIIDGLKQYLTKLFIQQSQDSVECVNKMDIDNISTSKHKRKRNDQELNNWYNELRKLRDDLDISDEFREFLENIWEIINDSDFVLNCDVDEIDFQRESKRHKKSEKKE